ncbi:hypothetical protein AAVH_20977 [Aphelenchoides avenae]|nr:hypothetical protein AAVH_20977 [Aphelenchus avenae]
MRTVLALTSLCTLVFLAYAKIDGLDKARRIGKNGLPDVDVVINADESVKNCSGGIRTNPDGIVIEAGDGSDVKVNAKEGPGYQAVQASSQCQT